MWFGSRNAILCLSGETARFHTMEKESIIAKLESRNKGTTARIIVDRPAKVRKTLALEAGDIRKQSSYSMQIAAYSNRAPVKQAVAEGEREAPSLPSWVAGTESFKNGLTFWRNASGGYYLALPLFGDKGKAKNKWFRNGKEVDFSEVQPFLLASEIPIQRETKQETEEKGQAQFNAIKIENILDIA